MYVVELPVVVAPPMLVIAVFDWLMSLWSVPVMLGGKKPSVIQPSANLVGTFRMFVEPSTWLLLN